MKKTMRHSALIALGVGLSSLLQAQEAGQANAADKANSIRTLEEVIVTARRKEESLQEVPVAVSALSGEALAREQISNLQDLQGRVPSMTVGSSGQTRNVEAPTIRGQGTSFGAGPGVVIYYNEVPLPADFPFSGQGGPGKFFDISNLQVLKGAQGTLFGRNTTGGALLLEPHRPENRLGASLVAQTSEYEGRHYEAIVNIPLVDEKLMVRAGALIEDRDGFTKDISSGKNLDDRHYWTGRLGILWQPTENIENYLLGYYTESDDNGTGLVIEGFNKEGLNYGLPATVAGILGVPLGDVAGALISLGIPLTSVTNLAGAGCLFFNVVASSTNCGDDIVSAQKARGIRKIETSLTPYDEIDTYSVMDKLSISLTDNLTLRNIFSYARHSHSFNWDADGSRAGLQDLATSKEEGYKAYDISQITEELQVQGMALDERLNYVIGGYYQKVEPEGPMGQHITALGLPLPTQEFTTEQESYAPYAQATYDLGGVARSLEGLNLTAGLRYTTDKIYGFSTSGDGPHSANLEHNALTYTFSLDYKIDNTLVYGKLSRGYKGGGFSATAVVPEDYTYKPEYVTNYELGQKSDFEVNGAPARINTAIYYTDYEDMQRSGIDVNGQSIGSAIFTAGSASIYGFEFEALVEPIEGLRWAINYAYTKGEYQEFDLVNNSANILVDCTGEQITQGNLGHYDCAPFQSTPRHQTSTTLSYGMPLGDTYGFLSGSLTYSWTDKQYSSPYSIPESEPGAWLEDYGLFNASLSWLNVMGSAFDLMVFGTNLTDEEYRISNSNTWNLVYYRASIYGEPRIVGARLSYRWDEE